MKELNLKDTLNEISSTALTHSGKFHADDVFSAALLKIIYPDITIQRRNSVPKDYGGLVFDIGHGKYDHHQVGSPIRDNGIPYAAFGLLWNTYGETILSKREAKEFDEDFVQPLDLNDNTGVENMLSDVIKSFNPVWNSENDSQKAFDNACSIAKTIIEKQFEKLISESKALEYIGQALDEATNGIMVLDKYVPWEKAIKDSKIKYVIFPSLRCGYNIQAVSEKYNFPEFWRGLNEDELVDLTEIPSITFCHKSGFLCSTNSLEDAKQLCVKSLSLLP